MQIHRFFFEIFLNILLFFHVGFKKQLLKKPFLAAGQADGCQIWGNPGGRAIRGPVGASRNGGKVGLLRISKIRYGLAMF